MRVLITQAVQDAAAVAAALQNRNHHALTVPVVNVERTATPTVKLEGAQGFIVASPDGARALADTISVRTFPVFADSRTTASELERLGFESVKSAKDDSADLARLIEKSANPNYGALIYACSTTAPVQLTALLSNMGFAVRSLPLYSVKRVEQVPPELSKILESGVDAALFLSADEARAFVTLIQREQLEPAVRKLKVVAANPVVAAPLRALNLGAVVVPPSGDLETVFAALDQDLVDKVEEERLDRERVTQEAAEQKRAENERRTRELMEKERIENELNEAKRIEEERAKIEHAKREQDAREKTEQERVAKEQAAAERAEQKRIAKETAAQEREEQERAKEERKFADNLERKQNEEAQAEQRRREAKAAELLRNEEQQRERLEAEKIVQERQALEKAALERKKAEEDASRDRAEPEELERKRQEREHAELAEQKRVAAEKAERDRKSAEIAEQARIADETEKRDCAAKEEKARAERELALQERAKKTEAEKDVAKEKKRALTAVISKEEKKESEPTKDDGTATKEASLKQDGGIGKFRSWFGRHKKLEATGPMFTHFQSEQASKNDVNDGVASTIPSHTLTPPMTKTATDSKTTQEPPQQIANQIEQPLPEEKQDVSQDPSSDPKEGPVLSKAPSSEPAAASIRGGGRAERLRAEDAADQQARQQRYKNFDIGDTPTERAPSSSDADQVNTREASRGVGRIVTLFVALVIVAAAILGTASWWVPQVSQMAQGPEAPKTNAPASAPTPSPATARVGALEQSAPNAASAEALSALKAELTRRMETIERGGGVDDTSIISMGDSLSSQARQLAAVSARLATLEAAIGNAARLEDLNNRLIVLEGKSADAASVLTLSDRVTSLEETSRRAVAEQTAEVALLMATAQLREAIVAGRPFATELETAKALSTRVLNSNIDDSAFATYAARGIPSLPTLRRRFDETAAQTVRADSIPDSASGWVRQSLDRLMSIITVRRVSGDIAGSGVSSILARAENRIISGDIAGAAVEMATLTGAAAETAGPWIADARARIAADQAITATLGKAMALMAVDERARTPAAIISEGE